MAIIYGTLSLAVFVMLLILYSQRLCFKRLLYRIASLFNDDIERRLLMASYTVFSSAAKLVARGKIVQIGSVTAGVWLCYFLSYGFFALFLQWHNFDFTLTRVFKTIFSLRGDSLFAAMFTKNITWTYGTWFVMYLIIPIFIVWTASVLMQIYRTGRPVGRQTYCRVLPQLKANERLAFLSSYFNEGDENKYLENYLEINKDVSVLRDYSAGSNATTILCMNDAGIFFRKYAFDGEADKLRQQRQWLKRHEAILPVAKVLRERSSDNYFYYDMEYKNDVKSFFSFIHTSSVEDSWSILQDVLKVLRQRLYNNHISKNCQQELTKYISQKVTANIAVCRDWTKKMFPELYLERTIFVNGVSFNNLDYYSYLLNEGQLFNVFKHDKYATIHGDLTIENIVCTDYGNRWYLIDPNVGNVHETPYLDFAKLLQSLHGRYEFLMMVDNVKINDNHIEFMYTYSSAYHNLYKKYSDYLAAIFSYAELKSIYFHEIVHWLRLMPYKIRKNPEKAVVFYAGMLMVLSDIEERFSR